jgi:hypothetical protein
MYAFTITFQSILEIFEKFSVNIMSVQDAPSLCFPVIIQCNSIYIYMLISAASGQLLSQYDTNSSSSSKTT